MVIQGMASPSPLRPSLPRHQSRVPGGFDTDDDLSPIKPEFDHAEDRNDYKLSGSSKVAATHRAEMDSSPLHAPKEEDMSRVEGNDSMLDEKEMARKLMDVESSFLPEISPAGPHGTSGADDTFAFGSPHLDARSGMASEKADTDRVRDRHYHPSQSPATPPESYQTPAPRRGEDTSPPVSPTGETPDHANTASLETMSSSPTAAAAARTVSRAVSMASIGGYETADEQSPSKRNEQGDEDASVDEDGTPRREEVPSRVSSRAGSPTPTKPEFSQDGDDAANGDIDDHDANTLRTRRKRPRVLNSRYASQRSSYSSRTSYTTTSTEGASDVTLGAEYALQTGGAVPFSASSGSSRPNQELSRSISLGSMASGISTQSDGEEKMRSVNSALDNLDPLLEEQVSPSMDRVRRRENGNGSGLHTPRAQSTTLDTPTETVINERVRNIEVPASMARKYQDHNRSSSPDKRNGQATPSIGRAGKNLTLKEQSSTIDKLQKENFSLKLKITFLESALDRQSDEGVKAMISENVELRTLRYNQSKELREAKRLMRGLEQKLKESEERAGQDELRTSRQTHESESEVIFLREKVETHEVEIQRLRHEAVARETEKRRLAEVIKSIGERRSGGSDLGVREEMVRTCFCKALRTRLDTHTFSRTCGRIF